MQDVFFHALLFKMPQQKQVERSIFPVPNTGQIIITQLKSTAWSVNGTFIISRLKIKLENINNIFETFRNRTAILFRITSHFLPVDIFWFSTFPMSVFRLQQRSYCWPLAMTTASFQVTMKITNSKSTTITVRWESMPQSSWILEARGCWASETPRMFGARGKGIVIWQSSHLEDPLDNGIFTDPYIFDVWIKWIGKYTVPCMDPVSCILTLEPWMKWTACDVLRFWEGKPAKYCDTVARQSCIFTWHDDKNCNFDCWICKNVDPFLLDWWPNPKQKIGTPQLGCLDLAVESSKACYRVGIRKIQLIGTWDT